MKTGGNDKYENTLALNCNILAEKAIVTGLPCGQAHDTLPDGPRHVPPLMQGLAVEHTSGASVQFRPKVPGLHLHRYKIVYMENIYYANTVSI